MQRNPPRVDADLVDQLDRDLAGQGRVRLTPELLGDPESRPMVLDYLAFRSGQGSTKALPLLIKAVEDYDVAGAGLRRLLVDPADVEDVRQEALIAATRAIASFEGRARFTTWFESIARNTAISFLRRRRDEAPLTGEETPTGKRLSSIVASRGVLEDGNDPGDRPCAGTHLGRTSFIVRRCR